MEYLIDTHTNDARELTPLINFTDNNYVPAPYEASSAVSSTHLQPRFGRTNEFDVLINGTSEDKKEYVMGIIIGAMIILIVALLWFFVIVCLKIAGQKKVGFLAGRLLRPSTNISHDDGVEVVIGGGESGENGINEAVPVISANKSSEDVHAEKKFTRTVWAVRGIFILSGIIVIISGGLFYGKGVVSFRNSVDEVRVGIDLAQTAAYKAINLTENVLVAEEDIEKEIEPSREVAASNGENGICGFNTELSNNIRNAYDLLSTNVDELKVMIAGTLGSFESDLKSVVKLTEDIDSSLNQADIFFYILIAISVIIIGIIVAMLIGVSFAWKGIQNCFTKCIRYAIIWPLFIFFLVLSWIFATLFLVASLAGADFCISPDQYVQSLLDNQSDTFDGIIFGFIIFYVSGCTILPPGNEQIIQVVSQINLVTSAAHDLLNLLGDLPIERLVIICGLTIEQGNALIKIAELGHDTTHVINNAMVGVRDVLACETFNPIYTTFVHQALCVEGVSGLSYIFATTLVISIFSMVMIMCRAALYPIVESNAKPVSGNKDAIEVVKYNENENSSGEGNGPTKESNAQPVSGNEEAMEAVKNNENENALIKADMAEWMDSSGTGEAEGPRD